MGRPDFSGKLVVVTNATKGTGLAIARSFAESGARVIAADAGEPDKDSIEELREQGLDVTRERLDVRRPIKVASLIEQLTSTRKPIDVWVNVFGDTQIEPAEAISLTDWENCLGRNLFGTIHCCQAAGKQMLAQGHGVIVNVASVNGLKVVEGHAATATAEAGIFALTNALGVEWAGRGVRVVAVAAGPNETSAPEAFTASGHNGFDPIRRVPLHRIGLAVQIADAVLFVASPQASFITAETVRVDGGWSAYQLF
jgi:NAD(P)-dependent dehydrogenase (short-subunit alcohol dehydrogenase family)